MDFEEHSLFAKIIDPALSKTTKAKYDIIQVVIDLLAEEGMDAATFKAVGDKLEMKPSHIAYYFPTRDEMILTAVKFAAAIGQQFTIEQMKKVSDPRKLFSSYLEAQLSWPEKNPKIAKVIILFFYQASHSSKYKSLLTEILLMGSQRIRDLMVSELKKRNPKDELLLAQWVQATLMGFLFMQLTSENFSIKKTTKKDFIDFILKMVEG